MLTYADIHKLPLNTQSEIRNMCPHTRLYYTSSGPMHTYALRLLYMCPYTTMCPHTTKIHALILLHASACYYIHVRILILSACPRPHTTPTHASSFYSQVTTTYYKLRPCPQTHLRYIPAVRSISVAGSIRQHTSAYVRIRQHTIYQQCGASQWQAHL